MSEHAEHLDARQQRGRSWIWAAIVVEIIGLAIESRPNPVPELAGFVGLAVVIAATAASARGARGIAMQPRQAHRSP